MPKSDATILAALNHLMQMVHGHDWFNDFEVLEHQEGFRVRNTTSTDTYPSLVGIFTFLEDSTDGNAGWHFKPNSHFHFSSNMLEVINQCIESVLKHYPEGGGKGDDF